MGSKEKPCNADPLDVKGAFDRMWWARLKNRLATRGMSGKALRLIRSHLHERRIPVVTGAESSLEKEIVSGVPQGAYIWNFEISEMPTVGPEATPFNYADDTGLLCVITESTHTYTGNQDLQALMNWGADNRTTFEPKKTCTLDGDLKEGVSHRNRDGRSLGQTSQRDEVGWFHVRCEEHLGRDDWCSCKKGKDESKSMQFEGWLALWSQRTCSRCTRRS